MIGPFVAAGFLLLWPGRLRTLFWLTAVPGAAAVLVAVLGVREVGAASPAANFAAPPIADLADATPPAAVHGGGLPRLSSARSLRPS